MDKLTANQKDKMYDEIRELFFKYGKDKTSKRMIESFFHELQDVYTSKGLCNMRIVSEALKYLLKITFPTK